MTLPPGAVEGTHRHVGSEELYYLVQGEGIAYIGASERTPGDPHPTVDRQIHGSGSRLCREVPVRPGSVIYTKDGEIHGIRNTSADRSLCFVAFLYHSA